MKHLVRAVRKCFFDSRVPFSQRRSRRYRPTVEQLECRQMPSGFTDYTALAQQFAPHQGLTTLYLNFDGGNIPDGAGVTQTINPLQTTAQDIQSVISQVAQIYAPFNVQVQQMTGFGNYDQGSNGNSTIFIGPNPNHVQNGRKYTSSFTPGAYVDSAQVVNGVNHRPDTEGYHLAFVDPVGPTATQSDSQIAWDIVHEAGHTFGLVHVLTGTETGAPQVTATNPPDVMSYDAFNKQFLDQSFPITDWNYVPAQGGLVHGGTGFFPHWLNGDGTTSTIVTQDSYSYLMAVLGPAAVAPVTPTPVGPSGKATSAQPTFSWGTVGGADHYHLWVDDTTTSQAQVISTDVTGASFTPTTPLNLGDSYRWWVRAVNGNGTQGAWSSEVDFTVALAAPVPQAPVGTAGATPTFSWTLVAGAAHYDLWVGDATSSQTQLIRQTVNGTSFTPAAPLQIGDSYRWWVRALSAGGSASDWSAVQTFNVALPAPTLLGPLDIAPSTLPTFSWSPVTGADHYTLSVDDVSSGQSQVVRQSVAGTSFTATTPLHGGDSYRWWAQALASSGFQSAWSSPANFTVTLATPVPAGPAGAVGSRLPVFSWNQVAGADNYNLYVSDVTAGQDGVINPSVAGTSYTPSVPLKTGDAYRWWVEATSSASGLKSSWSSSLDFSVTLGTPTPVGPTGVVSTTLPTFSWSAVGGVDHYVIWLDDVTLGLRGIIDTAVVGTSFTPTSPLTSNHAYRWWVLSAASDGGFSPWSQGQDFTVSLPAPVLQAPGGAATTPQPTFSWTAVAAASYYGLWLDDLTTGQQGILNLTVSGTSFTPTGSLAPGHLYRWWAYAGTNDGIASNWSVSQDFTVTLATPTPAGPTGMVYNTQPTFAWNAVSGADHYNVWLDDVTAGRRGIINGSVFATSFQPSTPLIGGHAYRWWVMAASNQNIFSSWSAEQDFTVAVGTPILLGPAGLVTNVQPTFFWSGINGANHYNLWVDDVTLGQRGIINISVSGTSYTPGGSFTINHSYRWWVQAVATDGTAGSWSSAVDFTVTLGSPTLIGPAGWSWDWQPTFGWTQVGGATSYELWVSDLSSGSNPVIHVTISGTSFTPALFLSLGDTYRWWVRAIAGDGTLSDWSSGLTFALPGLSAPPEANC